MLELILKSCKQAKSSNLCLFHWTYHSIRHQDWAIISWHGLMGHDTNLLRDKWWYWIKTLLKIDRMFFWINIWASELPPCMYVWLPPPYFNFNLPASPTFLSSNTDVFVYYCTDAVSTACIDEITVFKLLMVLNLLYIDLWLRFPQHNFPRSTLPANIKSHEATQTC